jgi:hypothetical protein
MLQGSANHFSLTVSDLSAALCFFGPLLGVSWLLGRVTHAGSRHRLGFTALVVLTYSRAGPKTIDAASFHLRVCYASGRAGESAALPELWDGGPDYQRCL